MKIFIRQFLNCAVNYLYHDLPVLSKCNLQPMQLSAYFSTAICNKNDWMSHPAHKHEEALGGIAISEYCARRTRLMESITAWSPPDFSRKTKEHIVIIPSATKVYMTENIPYPFRQNSDFRYLTGYLESDCVLVMLLADSSARHTSIIFVPKKDNLSEIWDGPRPSPQSIVDLLRVNESYEIDHFTTYLGKLFQTGNKISLWFDSHTCSQSSVQESIQAIALSHPPNMIQSPKLLLQEQRLIKSSSEVSQMRKSCSIASEVLNKVMETSHPDVDEHDLYAQIDYGCRIRGAERLAYPAVVAGGNRANIIHYIKNNQNVKNGQMVLVDAGCEYNGYVSDITRTWPVSGIFSARQKELYEVVLAVQKNLLALCETHISLDVLYRHMVIQLGESLQKLGVLSKSLSSNQRYSLANQLCPHHVGHYLGLDVHDTSLISRSRKLVNGMVITIEPGVYIREGDSNCTKDFHGLGVRIEDDVLITEHGCSVLSSSCVKEVRDIEQLITKK